MAEGLTAALTDAVRRNWWIVALVTAAALAAGAVAAAGAKTTYTAEARITISTGYSNKPGFPKPDELLADIETGEEFRSIAASETGLPAAELGPDRVNAYTLGDPQYEMYVGYESEDEAEAVKVAEGLARAATARSRELSEDEIDKARQLVVLTSGMVDEVAATDFRENDLRTQSEADLAKSQTLYSLQLSLVNQRSNLEVVENVYFFDGDVVVEPRTAGEAARTILIGAGFAGLVAGLALAGVRHILSTRGAASAAR